MIRMMQRTSLLALAAVAVCVWGAEQPLANDYPKRPVTIIVPAGAGAGPDVITRIVAERLSQAWGQQAVVSNRPGGGGMIATQAIAGVERDGYAHGLPSTQNELVREMLDWFQTRPEQNTPDESTVRRKVALVWRELNRA